MTYALVTGAAVAAAALLFCSAVMFRRAIRHAGCELTGGHAFEVDESYMTGKVRAVRLRCWRCGRTTKWYKLPKPAIAPEDRPAATPEKFDELVAIAQELGLGY